MYFNVSEIPVSKQLAVIMEKSLNKKSVIKTL